MKKLTSVILTLVMVISIMGATIIAPMSASAEASIKIGDYVQMGKYYDEPILWRCVDIDENGPLMLSDKILCIKPYDAKGDTTANNSSHGRTYNNGEYRKQYGSDYWADSNMRSWLNSTAMAGNVQWLCGNPPTKDKVWSGYNAYATEKGFMADGNFTASERNAIKTVKQKSLLNGYEHTTYPNIDPNRHRLDWNISSVVQNYATAYSEQVTDKMFLLDVKQANKVYQNLGNYYIGQPTQKAVDNSDYKDSSLSSGVNWYYFLRSPNADNYSGGYGRCVSSGGYVGCYFYTYYSYAGVRPAFYINLSSIIFKSGTGAMDSPYVATPTGVYVDISSESVTGTSSTGLTASINVNVGNYTNQILQGKLAIALYDNATNKLVQIKTSDCTLDSNNTTTINQTFAIGNAQYKVKAFCLNKYDTIQPLCSSVEKIIAPQ